MIDAFKHQPIVKNETTEFSYLLHKDCEFKRDFKTGNVQVFYKGIYYGYYDIENVFYPSVNKIWNETLEEIKENDV